MGRGATQETMNLTNQQLASQNALNQQLYGQNQSLQSAVAGGYQNLLDSLARTQGQQASSLAQQNQLAFANQSKQDQLSALQGLSGLYGTNSSLLGKALGLPGGLLNTDASLARIPSFGSSFLNALGGGLGSLL